MHIPSRQLRLPRRIHNLDFGLFLRIHDLSPIGLTGGRISGILERNATGRMTDLDFFDEPGSLRDFL